MRLPATELCAATAAVLGVLAAAPAGASPTDAQVLEALDQPPIVDGGPLLWTGCEGSAALVSALGGIAVEGDALLLSTGAADSPGTAPELDCASGDRGGLRLNLAAPADARALEIDLVVLSQDWQDAVHPPLQDRIVIDVFNSLWSGPAAIELSGAALDLDSALFGPDSDGQLDGTGLDGAGTTGWLRVVAPVSPGSVSWLALGLVDVGDSLGDTLMLVDSLRFRSEPAPGGWAWVGTDEPDEPFALGSLGPKSGPSAGGGAVVLRGVGFTEGTQVLWQGELLEDVTVDTAEQTIRVSAVPPGEVGAVEVGVRRPGMLRRRRDAYRYVDAVGAPGRRPELVAISASSGPGESPLPIDLTTRWLDADPRVFLVNEQDEVEQLLRIEDRQQGDGVEILRVVLPPHAPAFVGLRVVNADGTRSSPPRLFEYGASAATAAPPGAVSCAAAPSGSLLFGLPWLLRRRR